MGLFFLLTQPAGAARSRARTEQQLEPRSRRGGQRPRPVTAASDVPPHAFPRRGELSGVVYTAPLSHFGPEDTIADWPPATAGPAAVARKWRAAVSQGTLVLTAIAEPQPAAAQPKKQQPKSPKGAAGKAKGGGSESGAAAAPAAGADADASAATGEAADGTEPPLPPPPPAKVGIPLEGCTGGPGWGREGVRLGRGRPCVKLMIA